MAIEYDEKTIWPPVGMAPVRRSQQLWDAWYVGDPMKLAQVYGGSSEGSSIGSVYASPGQPHIYRSSQYAGGIVGALARFWWGQPNTSNSEHAKIHVPLAADIATGSADLLFGEELAVRWKGGVDPELMQEVLDENNFQAKLLEAAEEAAWSGSAYLRVVTDPMVSWCPIITTVPSEQAIPKFRWGRLESVQFWHVVKVSKDTVWRHIEEYTNGWVEHALYEGTTERLGRRVDLGAVPELLSLGVNQYSRVKTAGMAAFYVPNMLPSKLWKDHRDMGRSDYAGNESLFDALDEVWSSMMRDVRLGKARLIVPQNALKAIGGPGGGSSFDIDQEVFVELNMPANTEGKMINEAQFEIRSQQHLEIVTATMVRAIEGCGYAAASFGLGDEGSAQTAAEVKARRERSLSTRSKKINYWTGPLQQMLDCLCLNMGQPAGTTIEFPKSVSPNELELAQVAQAWYNAKAASTRARVELIHPTWDSDQVDEEVALIEDESSLADPTQVGLDAAERVASLMKQEDPDAGIEPDSGTPGPAGSPDILGQ